MEITALLLVAVALAHIAAEAVTGAGKALYLASLRDPRGAGEVVGAATQMVAAPGAGVAQASEKDQGAGINGG